MVGAVVGECERLRRGVGDRSQASVAVIAIGRFQTVIVRDARDPSAFVEAVDGVLKGRQPEGTFDFNERVGHAGGR